MVSDNKKIYEIDEINHLYKMQEKDIDSFAECAALAYINYPLFEYLVKNNCDYKIIKTILYASIKAMPKETLGISTDDKANAVAIFAPPGYTGTKPVPFFLGGGIKLTYLASPSIFYRLLNYENHSMKLKKEYTNNQSWYLYNVTVKPEYQGNGMGSKLLKPMFEYFDRTSQDCYLETHKKENIELYEHLGFELLGTSKIPQTDVDHYAMLRKSK